MPPSELAAWLQLAVFVVGLGTVLVRLGSRNETLNQTTADLKELTAIVRDLVRSQVEGEVRHDAMRDTLDELRKRLDRLEASRWGGVRDSH
ncbi:MAG: hypothetical protein ACO31E_12625 [Phycisphaerales bacterium]